MLAILTEARWFHLRCLVAAALCCFLAVPMAGGQQYAVFTLAGNPQLATEADGVGGNAVFHIPGHAAVDQNGNVYVTDWNANTIRMISPGGYVTTIAGQIETSGHADGSGTHATFNHPAGIAVDAATNLYIADYANDLIRKMTLVGGTWDVTTIAGTVTNKGYADGVGTNAQFNNPVGIAVDHSTNLYIADMFNDTIRQLTATGSNWVVTTLAGVVTNVGSADGTNNHATFYQPEGVCVDTATNIYVADTGNGTIRIITLNGTNAVVKTIAGKAGASGKADGVGTTARFNKPIGICLDATTNLYVNDSVGTIRKISPGGSGIWNVLTIAGTSKTGYTNGVGTNVSFGAFELFGESGIASDSVGNIYVMDDKNAVVRKGVPYSNQLLITTEIYSQNATLLFGANQTFTVSAVGTEPYFYQWMFGGVSIPGATNSNLILTNIQVTNRGDYGVVVSNSSASAATTVGTLNVLSVTILSQPQSLAANVGSNAFFSVQVNSFGPPEYQWLINSNNITGATNAMLALTGVQFSDGGNYQVIASNLYGAVTSSVAVLTVTTDPVVPPAFMFSFGKTGVRKGQFNNPYGMGIDGSGNIFVADTGNNRVEKFNSNGIFVLDWGGPGAKLNQFSNNYGIALDTAGNVYVTDQGNNRIQVFDNNGGYLNEWNSTSATAVAIDNSNNVFVADYNPPSGNDIVEFDVFGNINKSWNAVLTPANAVTVDNRGYVYGMKVSGSQIFKFNSFGKTLLEWGGSGTNAGQFGAQGLAADTNGNIYVADTDNHRIEKFNSNNAYITQWGVYGTNVGQFNTPARVAVDQTGNYVFVADTYNDRIQVFGYVFPPFVIQQPLSQPVQTGTNVSFTIIATSPSPLSYQWLFNGVNLSDTNIIGQGSSAISISNVQPSNAGYYQVVVSNMYGSVTSSVAALNLTNVPISFDASQTAFDASGRISITMANLTGQGTIVVSASTNLIDWVPVFTNAPGFGSFTFTDVNTTNYGSRFYRASVLSGN